MIESTGGAPSIDAYANFPASVNFFYTSSKRIWLRNPWAKLLTGMK